MSRTIIFISLIILTLIPIHGIASESNPFAEKHVVLQISNPNPFKQTLVLNVASNLPKTLWFR